MTLLSGPQCLSSIICTEKGIKPSFIQVMKDAKLNDSKHPERSYFSGELIIEHDDIALYPDLVPILAGEINDAYDTYPLFGCKNDNDPTKENQIILTWSCDYTHHRKIMVHLKDLFDNSDRFSFCGRSNHYQGVLVRCRIMLVDERSNEVVDIFFEFGIKTILGGDNLRKLSGFSTYYTKDYFINGVHPPDSL
jgi:hypothetical protein